MKLKKIRHRAARPHPDGEQRCVYCQYLINAAGTGVVYAPNTSVIEHTDTGRQTAGSETEGTICFDVTVTQKPL